MAQVYVCSPPNKIREVFNLVNINNIHILTLTQTQLDTSVNDGQINICGYSLLRRDRNRNGGGVALYIQNHIPFKRRDDLNVGQIEALWAQVHLPHQAPILVGCVYIDLLALRCPIWMTYVLGLTRPQIATEMYLSWVILI